jgi:hypothetical protein
VVLPEPELPDAAFAGADLRKRGLLMVGGAVAGFLALVALAVSMSSRSIPNAPHAKPESQVQAPAAPDPSPATAEATAAQPTSAPALAELRAAAPAPTPAPVEPAAPSAETAAPAQPAATQASAAAPAKAEPLKDPTPVAIVQPAPAPPAATAPEDVRVHISATPGSARIVYDGNSVSNPYDAHAAKGEHHRVQVEAPGHAPRDITLSFERDQKLTVKLDRTHPAPAAHAPAPVAVKASAPAHAASAPEHATLTITPRPATPTPKPGAGKGAGFVSESPY